MTLEERYVLVVTDSPEGSWDIDDFTMPEGVKRLSLNGEPLADRWNNASASLRGGDPAAPRITDSVTSAADTFVVSARLKAALERLKVTDVEYLPLSLTVNDVAIGLPYFLVNFINSPDCLDVKASEPKFSRITKTKIDSVARLALTRDPERSLFRLATYRKVLIASFELAEALATQPFSGLRYLPLYNHPDFDWSKQNTPLWKRVEALYEQQHRNGTFSL